MVRSDLFCDACTDLCTTYRYERESREKGFTYCEVLGSCVRCGHIRYDDGGDADLGGIDATNFDIVVRHGTTHSETRAYQGLPDSGGSETKANQGGTSDLRGNAQGCDSLGRVRSKVVFGT